MPRLQMFIQNPASRSVYVNRPINVDPVINVSATARQGPRLAIGGAMIGRIQFSKSGCGSCGK
jgi:hypothetical protein